MPDSGLRVLVVDDERDLLEMTCRMLRRLQHEPVPADGGARAIELLQAESFDLAVVDCRMPGVNGNTVRRFIEQNQPHLRVITASGTLTHNAPEEINVAAHVFLSKPFTFAELQKALETATANTEAI